MWRLLCPGAAQTLFCDKEKGEIANSYSFNIKLCFNALNIHASHLHK